MSVALSTTKDLARTGATGAWAAIPPTRPALDPGYRMPGLAAALEAAFDAATEDWLELGCELGGDESAVLAHAPACAANASDLGQMLAWTRLVENWASSSTISVLVVCDDPWLFRQLSMLHGVTAGAPPPLRRAEWRLFMRGYAARIAAALRVTASAVALGRRRAAVEAHGVWLLVYGHPASAGDGRDAYFGDLMQRLPGLRRVLHADCPVGRARELAAGSPTASLHAWGWPGFALALPFHCWRPGRKRLEGRYGWLVRRAAALEGGTGQAAMIAWQLHCQERWLQQVHPRLVAWPWENHSWERAFVRNCRKAGVETLGYQHSVVGRQMLNYAVGSNPDGLSSVPDQVLCSGEATHAQLVGLGLPVERAAVGGALRFPVAKPVRWDRHAPVFVALPFDGEVSAEMARAAREASRSGLRFLLKAHPMTPHYFAECDAVRHTDRRLEEQNAVSAVVFAATTVGLEALLAGLPTLRFRPADRISIDILPAGIDTPTTDAESLADDLMAAVPPGQLPRDWVFAPVDYGLWSKVLLGGERSECA